jgi:hypothetical protein
MSLQIFIETIKHKDQRYPSCGDWFWEKTEREDRLIIKVSKLSDWRRESLIAVHELIEVLLCKEAGISQQAVDKFDMDFEKKRKKGDDSEPGDSLKAPYYAQHQFASKVEKMLAHELRVNWEWYAREVERLP